jgi:hypothetical protein
VVVEGSGTTVVIASAKGAELVAWIATGAAPFALAAVEQPTRAIWPADGTSGPAGLLIVGHDPQTGRPAVWRSVTGEVWARLGAVGFGRAGTVAALSATAEGYIAVGAITDGTSNSSAPAAWLSEEGQRWRVVKLPSQRGGEAVDVVSFAGGLVAVGVDGDSGRGVIWRSINGGAGWSRAELGDTVLPPYSIASVGDAPLFSGLRYEGDDGHPVLLRSPDGGQTWGAVDLPAEIAVGLTLLRVSSTGNRAWAVGSRQLYPARHTAICARNVRLCERAERVVLTSADGAEWSELDLTALPRVPSCFLSTALTSAPRVISCSSRAVPAS